MYEDLGEAEKSFENRLMAAYLVRDDIELWLQCVQKTEKVEQKKYCVNRAIKLLNSRTQADDIASLKLEKVGIYRALH